MPSPVLQAVRRAHAVIALAALTLGLVALVWRGPGRELVRGSLGDVAAAGLLAALAGVARPRWSATSRAGLALGAATGVEVVQALAGGRWQGATLAELTVGTTFDPTDLLAYAVGAILAATGGAWLARRAPFCAGGS